MSDSARDKKVKELVDVVGGLSADEIAVLGKLLSERWGVSAMAPVAAAPAASAAAPQGGGSDAAKSEYNIAIKGVQSGKLLEVLKAARALFPDAGSIGDVREKLNNASASDSYVIATNVAAKSAKEAVEKLASAGAVVEAE